VKHQAVTHVEGEIFTHKELWRCAEIQLDAARTAERGRFYFDMAAMLMAFFAYEAYLNFLGEILAPKQWGREREFFREPPYQGFEGKAQFIHEQLGLVVNKGNRPHQTVQQLLTLRDTLAHGKPDRFEKVVQHGREVEVPLFGHGRLENQVSAECSERALADIRQVIEALHELARTRLDPNDDRTGWLRGPALAGPFGYSSGHTKAVP